MATDVNPLDNVVTLLTSNYVAQDDIIPTIAKIYTKPSDKEPKPNQDFIYVYSELTTQNSTGLNSGTVSEIIESIKIDIRSRPSNAKQINLVNDAHARKVLAEVRRILYSNIVNPDSTFDIIDPFMETTDLSNGGRGIFRYIIKIRLIDYCRDMTA